MSPEIAGGESTTDDNALFAASPIAPIAPTAPNATDPTFAAVCNLLIQFDFGILYA